MDDFKNTGLLPLGNPNQYQQQQPFAPGPIQQQQFQQPQYQQQQFGQFPQQQNPFAQYQDAYEDTSVMGFKDWLLTILITCIPILSIVMLIVWSFGQGNTNRKNFARAALVLWVVSLIICGAFTFMFWPMIMASYPS